MVAGNLENLKTMNGWDVTCFEDINGHLWEIIYMDKKTIKNGEKHS